MKCLCYKNLKERVVVSIKDAAETIAKYCNNIKTIKKVSHKKNDKGTITYIYNVSASFDIEASSFISHGIKYACMYHWQFGINGIVITGRTWDEYERLCNILVKMFGLGQDTKLIIYVHNLAYEFQWIKTHHTWRSVFAVKERTPVKALTTTGLEFRCSYLLSGYGLDKTGKNLIECPIEKLSGYLDYTKIRHSYTNMTEKEVNYCIADVQVVMSYIQEYINAKGDITKLPLTKTGAVREYVRNHTIYSKDTDTRVKYKKLMHELTLTSEEYKAAKRAYCGGFTHANSKYVDKILSDVDSMDFTSSYPFCLLLPIYPITKGKYVKSVKPSDMELYSNPYTVSIFTVRLRDLERKSSMPDDIISISKCYKDKDCTQPYPECEALVNNGRVTAVSGDVFLTVTSVDWDSIKEFYTFSECEIYDLWYYRCSFLPKALIECILDFYEKKTVYKNDDAHIAEYFFAKENLNAIYGMMVTDIARNVISYINSWDTEKLDDDGIEKVIESYNSSQTRFVSYLWGVFCTALARRNLFSGIRSFGSDYVYSDTDSIKCLNFASHKSYYEKYNEWAIDRLRDLCNHYDIDFSRVCPKDIKGIEHPLGVWDWETRDGNYKKFKTLGAKRYLYELQNGYKKLVVAGLPKDSGQYTEDGTPISCIDVLSKKYNDIFSAFDSDMHVSETEVNKLLLTYIDTPTEFDVTDYLGNTVHQFELSSVHMSKIGFDFDRSIEFYDYLMGGWISREDF